jgi:tetratricopeptide (TPR) repeat protein
MPIPLTINMDVCRYKQLGEYLEINHPDLYQYIDSSPTVKHSMVSLHIDTCAIIADKLLLNMEYDMAEPLYRSIIYRCHQVNGEDCIESFPFIEKLADCLFNLFQMGFTEKLVEIEPMLNYLITLKHRFYGSKHYSTINSILDMACFYTFMSKYEKALKLYEDIIAIHAKVKDINYPYFLRGLMELCSKLDKKKMVKYTKIAHKIAEEVFFPL